MKRETLEAVRRDVAARRAVVLVTDVASGDEWLVHPDVAGGEPAMRAAAIDAARRDASELVEAAGRRLFLHVFNPPVKVIVVGAVHITQPLAPMIRLAGHDVVVVDPRRSFATEERFPGTRLERAWPEEALPRIGLDRRTAVVTLTHDPKIDDPALAAALRSEAFYVGCLGSRKTQAARRERLRAIGFGDADLARVHGPVGLPIGATGPGEIAAAIVADVVATLRARPGSGAGE
jgi:xanthine dehydrogenase accessory factor